jgi:transposase
MILLKSEGYTSKKISNILNTNGISVHNWVKRYERDGIEGLRTKPGQGRKRILEEDHIDIVRAAVEQERQRLSQAQKIIEQNIGKKMSNETLTCFLEVITAVTSE